MTHLATATVDTSGLSDRVVSWLRTVVPGAWAALIAWLLGRWPALADLLASWGVDLTSPMVASWVVALVLAAWYAGWRWAEPRLPAWLTRLVLGASRAPTYGVTVATGQSATVVRLAHGLPIRDDHLHECQHGAQWPSAALAAECPCDRAGGGS